MHTTSIKTESLFVLHCPSEVTEQECTKTNNQIKLWPISKCLSIYTHTHIIVDPKPLLTLKELIQGMVSVAHYQHWSLFKSTSPKTLIGQQSLSNLKANVGFS